MRLYKPGNTAQENLERLASHPYPGRVLVMGYAGNVAVQAYAIGGRSDDSRNRIFVIEDKIASTEVFDKTKPAKHPHLTIYDAMRRIHRTTHIVSNGDQTGTAIQYERSERSFAAAMASREYEDDGPNYTSRISGRMDLARDRMDGGFVMSVIRRTEWAPHAAIHELHAWLPDLESGEGLAVQTYRGQEGERLLPFTEDPFELPVADTAEDMAELLWNNLDHGTRVAVVAKVIDMSSGTFEYARRNGHELAA